VLGGGGTSPTKVNDYSSSPAGRRVELSRVTDEDYTMNDEEDGVMGLLFAANTSDEDFVPPPGLGKGKGKSRAVPMDGVVDSPSSVGASSSTRVRRKRRRKLLSDETEAEHQVKHDDGGHESEEGGSRAHAISTPAPGLLNARPKKHAQAQDALYANDRRVGRRAVPQDLLRLLYRETVRRMIPVHNPYS
jgi:hypothetical protein